MIAISLAPNFTKRDARLALKLLFSPWRYFSNDATYVLEKELKEKLGANNVYLITSARWGLYEILSSLNLPNDSEILLQAFTCVSVPGPILWANLKPVYVDILPRMLTMDPVDLEKKISNKSRVLIIQHTFGVPALLDELIAIAKKHNLIIIEDCAHTIGTEYKGKKLGTFGDAAILSFGRDKAISSVFGGAVVINNKEIFSKLSENLKKLPNAKSTWIIQQLLHPILFEFIVKPLYFVARIGKIKLVIFQRMSILSKAIIAREKHGGLPAFPSANLPGALAELAMSQLSRLESFNTRRREIAEIYVREFKEITEKDFILPEIPSESKPYYLRYTVQTSKAKQIFIEAKRKKILLGDWYEVIAPKDTDLAAVNYKKGSCPVAEHVAQNVLNLPTYPVMTKQDAKIVVELVKSFFKS